MRELTGTEVAQISGGVRHSQIAHNAYVDPKLINNLHTQVQQEMEKVLRDMQRNVQDCS